MDVTWNMFNSWEAYTIYLKTDNKAIGVIELKLNGHTDMTKLDDECELGYWLGKSFWARGMCRRLSRRCFGHAFEDTCMHKAWCGYYDGNLKIKRGQKKCGFRYQWVTENVDALLMHEKRTGHVKFGD